MMLGTFWLRISYSSFPDFSVAFALFLVATGSFLLGYGTLRWSYIARRYSPKAIGQTYRVKLRGLRWLHIGGVALVLTIMLINLKLYGLPPVFAVLGNVETPDYQEYGSLRQPMFAALLILFISAPLEPSVWRRWALYFFAPSCFLIYGSRGYLLIMLFQSLAVFSLRTRKSKVFIYGCAALTLVTAVLMSNLIGNSRNSLGIEALLGYLQIRVKYYDWPAAYLWVISYISTPFSNMCWMIKVFPYQHPSLQFLYSTLPGFLSPASPDQAPDLGSEKIIDGVHTYMAKYFIDFWYFGIVGINYVWGALSAAMTAGNRLTRNSLLSSVLLGCMAFMFFTDFLTILIVMLEMLAAWCIQRYLTTSIPDAELSMSSTVDATR